MPLARIPHSTFHFLHYSGIAPPHHAAHSSTRGRATSPTDRPWRPPTSPRAPQKLPPTPPLPQPSPVHAPHHAPLALAHPTHLSYLCPRKNRFAEELCHSACLPEVRDRCHYYRPRHSSSHTPSVTTAAFFLARASCSLPPCAYHSQALYDYLTIAPPAFRLSLLEDCPQPPGASAISSSAPLCRCPIPRIYLRHPYDEVPRQLRRLASLQEKLSHPVHFP